MEHVLTTREHLGRRGKRLARPARRDWLFAVGTGLASIPLTFVAQGDNAHTPDVLGWTLFGLSALTLAWRRHYPMGALLVLIVVEGTYHVLGNAHSGLIAVTIVAIYSLAVAGPRRRTLAVVPTLLGLSVIMLTSINPERGIELLRISGWILACAITGEAVRVHRNYIGAVVERAERAERTREEEARRRVAEERLRIARDLHDLLAHTITLIGVQTSVAAHVLAADPDRLDREAVAKALDDISGTCRSARGELRATLEVLRESQYGETGAVRCPASTECRTWRRRPASPAPRSSCPYTPTTSRPRSAQPPTGSSRRHSPTRYGTEARACRCAWTCAPRAGRSG